MIDFFMVATRPAKRGVIEIYPKFIVNNRSKDLMIRGADFYAVWLEDRGLWSTDEQDVIDLIDAELDKYAEENRHKFDGHIKVLHMRDAETKLIDAWHHYCKNQLRDSFHMLDEKLIFSNTETKKRDYASKKLEYPLEPGNISAWDKLISTLYSEEERHKIEWAIGSIVSGDSKTIQKFMVLYGAAGTGKSTILNVIQQLFEGYYSVFDAKSLGSSSDQFALEAFKTNPLVAIQHDGDLSKIEDNTRLNSLVSHEKMTVNEKFKGRYTSSFKCFLFMGTNKPVKITDGKSGLIRRLIDVTPSGNKLNPKEYRELTKQVSFELGHIAQHCLEVYLDDPGYYDDYIPKLMMGASNDFYNFVLDSYHIFKREDGVSLKAAWEMYNTYCAEAKVPYPFPQRGFKEELKNYFWNFDERFNFEDGSRVRSYYSGFRTEKFETEKKPSKKPVTHISKLLDFREQNSILDELCADCPAQYATTKGTPAKKWEEVTTKLSDLDTSRLHFVNIPDGNHIVIDFDIPDENGKKCYAKNAEAAAKWPATYGELSKSGEGIHLHYIYKGDVSKLSRIYEDHIEVKIFNGNSSLRRKLTKCNNLPMATISSGLPLKGDDKLVNFEGIKSEKALRTSIKRNLNKEIHPGTKPSVDFIYKILEDAYNSGMCYDVSDMRNDILGFAANSTNQAAYCIKLVNKMHFKSEEPSLPGQDGDGPLAFYDIEVFPNLFLVNWKFAGPEKPVVRMINPTSSDIEQLLKLKLVGYNCRRYDNHILYARLMGYNNEELYRLSQKIVNSKKGENNNCFFGEAYNISYTDVYDFSSDKKSLKKWEIELGIHHQELGLPWDKPVPEELWDKVAEYCDNDVIATEAVFNHLTGDWTARQILADLAGMSFNDTTNSLTGRILFGSERKPQGQFNWRDLSQPVLDLPQDHIKFLEEIAPAMMLKRHGKAGSLLPYFEGYKYEFGKSTYKGVEVGEGGRVFARPGIWTNVPVLDITSMHPHSAMMEVLFGVKFTRRFREIVYGRVHIKHKAWEEVNQMLDGKLTPYIQKVINGEMTNDELADALKIAINSVYGLTAANFDNLFRDPRNKDNIVAKRGALFMVDLQEAVEAKGFTVVHIKTDSIKIADATKEIIDFVMEFGARYGYTFEHESTYDRMCLVNDAVYIAKYASVDWCQRTYGYVPSKQEKKAGKNGGWDATGTQFAVPYVFKSLFSKEPIEFSDLCETKEVKSTLYLDMNECLPDVSEYEKLLSLRRALAGGKEKNTLSKKDFKLVSDHSWMSDEELEAKIAEGHDYHFVGRIGQFCPVKPGRGGGELRREGKDANGNVRYDYATGAKGYRWMEAEAVKLLNEPDIIDKSYHKSLVDAAVAAISEYGDFEWFVSDTEPVDLEIIANSHGITDLPWKVACGKDSCDGCPHRNNDDFDKDCALGYDISDVLFMESQNAKFLNKESNI